jgi:hypothetical protein
MMMKPVEEVMLKEKRINEVYGKWLGTFHWDGFIVLRFGIKVTMNMVNTISKRVFNKSRLNKTSLQ